MDDYDKIDWQLDLADLRHTLPDMAVAQILLATTGAAAVIALVAVFFGR